MPASDNFRDQLEGIVPEAPETRGWSTHAVVQGVRRRRRRQTVAASLTAVVVVVALVIASPYLLNWPSGSTASKPGPGVIAGTPAPSGDKPTSNAGEQACPTDQKAYGDGVKTMTLPKGPISLRWCTWADPEGGFMSEWAPPELLTTGLDDWVTTFNSLKPVNTSGACTSDWSVPALALLTYADGSTRTVAGMRAGCGTIGGRLGFTTMQHLTIELFGKQRGSEFAPQTVPFTPCKNFNSTIPARLSNVTTIAVCETFQAVGPEGAKMVESHLVESVRIDIVQHLADYTGDPMQDGPRLMLYQANGELLAMWFNQANAVWLLQDGENWKAWKPSEASRKAIASALPIKASATPAPSTHQDQPTTPDPCQSSITKASSIDPLPREATKVWLCSQGRYAPPEALLGERAATLAAETHSTIEPCLEHLWDESFIAEYADGQRVRMVLPASPCLTHGAAAALGMFPSLMEQQRAETGLSAPVQHLGKLCHMGQTGNVMPMKLTDVTEVRQCYFTTTVQDERHSRGVALAPDEQKLLLDDLSSNSVTVNSALPTMPGIMLVLLRSNGERIWVRYATSDSPLLYWQAPGEAHSYTWTPTPEVQAIIDRLTKTK